MLPINIECLNCKKFDTSKKTVLTCSIYPEGIKRDIIFIGPQGLCDKYDRVQKSEDGVIKMTI